MSGFTVECTPEQAAISDLDRRISLLLSTREGTVPLDREFGLNMDFLDSPSQTAKSLYAAEVTKKVARFIPEARVQSITWIGEEMGKLTPKVVITNA